MRMYKISRDEIAHQGFGFYDLFHFKCEINYEWRH